MNTILNNLTKTIQITLLMLVSTCVYAVDPVYSDDSDLVIADITPHNQMNSGANALEFSTIGEAHFKYVGPGIVTHKYQFQEVTASYTSGVHSITISENAITRWKGGHLFLKSHPQVTAMSVEVGAYTLYAPASASGDVQISTNGALEVTDVLSNELLISTGVNTTSLTAGRLLVNAKAIQGEHSSGNINPYLSPYKDRMLMTRQMAVDDALLFQQVTTVNKNLGAVLNDIDSVLNRLNDIESSLLTGNNSSSFLELAIYNDTGLMNYLASLTNKYRDVNRSIPLDDMELVLADVVPNRPATTDATSIETNGYSKYVYVGPGSVNIAYADGTSEVRNFGENAHHFSVNETAKLTWLGGYLFLDLFTEAVVLANESYWLYVPGHLSNQVDIRVDGSITIDDGNSQHQIVTDTLTATINPGQVYLDHTGGTHSTISAGNINKYLSPYSGKALLPRNIAVADGLTYVDVTDENTTSQYLVYKLLRGSIGELQKSRKSVSKLQYK